MQKTIRARYQHGHIEPLALPEGIEVEVTLTLDRPPVEEIDPTTATAGAWRDLLDTEGIYRASDPVAARHAVDTFLMDLFIAVACLHHGLTLLTPNRQHFERIPSLPIISD